MQVLSSPVNKVEILHDLKRIPSPGCLWLIKVSIQKTNASTTKIIRISAM